MKVGIYSALYGAYDTFKDVQVGHRIKMFHDLKNWDLGGPDQGFDLVSGYDLVYYPHRIVSRHGDPALVAPMLAHKWWKTHPTEALPGVDVSIWVDASITLHAGFVEHALRALGDDDWAMVPHPWRDCIFDEAEYSASLPRYASLGTAIRRQAAWYTEMGHPTHWGLPATGVIVRRHTPAVARLSDYWWHECFHWSHQDQISLPVLMRSFAHDVKYNYNLPWEHLWSLSPHLK